MKTFFTQKVFENDASLKLRLSQTLANTFAREAVLKAKIELDLVVKKAPGLLVFWRSHDVNGIAMMAKGKKIIELSVMILELDVILIFGTWVCICSSLLFSLKRSPKVKSSIEVIRGFSLLISLRGVSFLLFSQ